MTDAERWAALKEWINSIIANEDYELQYCPQDILAKMRALEAA